MQLLTLEGSTNVYVCHISYKQALKLPAKCFFLILQLLGIFVLTFEKIMNAANNQTWGQVHEYLYLSTFKYTFQSTCSIF